MDPATIVVTALVAGAVAAAKDVTTQAIKDSYAGLKALVIRRFGGKGDVADTVQKAEQKPDSKGQQETLKEELAAAGADQDLEVLKQAQALLDLLRQQGHDVVTYSATLVGDGAIAQGPGAVAAGARGVAVRGDAHGPIITGDDNTAGNSRTPARKETDK